jgi:undecaprenyl-diphosphatase
MNMSAMKATLFVASTVLACVAVGDGGPSGLQAACKPAARATAARASSEYSGVDSVSAAPGGTTERAESRGDQPYRPETKEDSPDVRLFRYMNGALRNPVFDAIMPIATDFRRSRVVVILVWAALVIFGGGKGRWAALMLIPIIAASDQISSHLIKQLVERLRPCEVLGSVHFWHGPEGWIVTPPLPVGGFKTSFSFPSSHAANITSSMIFLALVYRRWMAIPIAVMTIVSFSRIYIGVHWPSDVAVGMALGAALALPAYLIFKRFSGYNSGGDEISGVRKGRTSEPVEKE